MSQKKYQVTLTENQLNTLVRATEVLARLGIGQWRHGLDHLPLMQTRHHQQLNDDVDEIGRLLSKHMKDGIDGWTRSLSISGASEDAKVAWDLYQTLRHHISWQKAVDDGWIESMNSRRNFTKMWQVYYDEPMLASGQPKAEVVTKPE
jgi:hypothetical protein